MDGALVAALAAVPFAEAARIERGGDNLPGRPWLFDRRIAIFLAIPFAIVGHWPIYLGLAAFYAAASFFFVQHIRHGLGHSAQR